MHWEPNGSLASHRNHERPTPTSYDSPHEHSWEHWVELRELVEEEDEDDEVSSKHERGRGTAA